MADELRKLTSLLLHRFLLVAICLPSKRRRQSIARERSVQAQGRVRTEDACIFAHETRKLGAQAAPKAPPLRFFAKEWDMAQIRLRAGTGAGLLALVLSLGSTGCLGVDGNRHVVSNMPAPRFPAGVDPKTPAPGMSADMGVVTSDCGDPGCTSCGKHRRRHGDVVAAPAMMASGPMGPCPTELDRVSLPPYKVGPSDILFLDMIRMVPRPPYRVEPLEALVVTVTDTLPNQPIAGPFVVSPEGTINLGFSYGTVYVGNMTIDQIQNAIRTHLTRVLRNPQVTVALAQIRGMQQVRGETLVRPDGTIHLGVYGSVYVAGLSLGQVKCVVEKHLSEYFLNPQVSVDVFAYNSRAIYVIIDGGHLGQQVIPIPSTGNETVLDAISKVQGLAPVSSKKRIWIARPSPVNMGCNQVLPVDWRAITEGGSTGTNYQLFPGDRVYVGAQPLIAFDNWLSIVLAPVERILGVTFLGVNTWQAFSNGGNGNNAAVFVP